MKKLFAILTLIFIPAFCLAITLIDVNITPPANNSVPLYGNFRAGQTFTATANYTINAWRVQAGRHGDQQGNLISSIYSTDGNGKPDQLLRSYVFKSVEAGTSFITAEGQELLTLGQKYAIVLSYPDGDDEHYISIAYYNNDGYPQGTMYNSTDGGTTWLSNEADYIFETYGTKHLFSLPLNAIASTTGISSALVNNLAIFIELAIGVPLAFYFVKKWLNVIKI